ncbi:MAG: hypothetical protein J6T01_02485 [Kiritimatiellae bacterium]|nr:hypothetical protein [Kiritimatiellia bacterium]
MNIDVKMLAGRLADRMRLVSFELTPVHAHCAWPVFKGIAEGTTPVFVKLTERDAAERSLAFLAAASGVCPFLPKPVMKEALEFEGLAAICTEWKEAVHVNAEDMTEGQLGAFAEGCRLLAKALSEYRGRIVPLSDEDSPARQYDELRCYSLRHPIAGRLIRPLLEIPERERSYGGRRLTAVHGDLQPRNYGFDGDRFAAVFDTDDITEGIACEDPAYAFTERVRRAELSAQSRRRLADMFCRMAEMSPWPKEDWIFALNRARLRIAARRLARHPDAAFVAFDIRRRDAPLRNFSDCVRRRFFLV